MKKIGLLPRILIAIVLGIVLGQWLTLPWVRAFVTFNGIFSQLLGFLIPFIIIGLVTPSIAEIGKGAGRLLLATVAVAYFDTVFSGLLAFFTGSWLFPAMVEHTAGTVSVEKPADVEPFFVVNIPAMFDVMSALVFSFMVGLVTAHAELRTLKAWFTDFREVIVHTIAKVIIPLLPLYIFGIFLQMTHTGQVAHIVAVFAQIILVIFVLHLAILLYEFCVAGAVVRRNPLRLLATMLPAYFTALGTSSSAATIPVTLRQAQKNGVSPGVAGFTIPLCATIHMPGSAMKITACALTICLMQGHPCGFPVFMNFIMMLAIVMVAAPGVPGGVIMAALGPLASILGFSTESQALMMALYIAMDSFGTACNVTGDGAVAVLLNRFFGPARSKDS